MFFKYQDHMVIISFLNFVNLVPFLYTLLPERNITTLVIFVLCYSFINEHPWDTITTLKDVAAADATLLRVSPS